MTTTQTAPHPDEDHKTTRHHEHGRDWLTCNRCGASWSVHEIDAPTGPSQEDFERIDEGDGYCEEFAASLAALDSDEYDVDAIQIDFNNGNFDPDSFPEGAEEYRYVEQIAQSILNGQWTQARAQFARYGDHQALYAHLEELGEDAGRLMLKFY